LGPHFCCFQFVALGAPLIERYQAVREFGSAA